MNQEQTRHFAVGERSCFEGPVVLVVSPHAGHASGDHVAARSLEAAGVRVGRQIMVSELDERVAEGGSWREAGFRAAIAAGGDGTIGAVASHLRGSDLPLGILPLGTANDIARSLDIPLALDAAARVIAHGATRALDAGQALPALTEPGALAVEAAQAAEPRHPSDAAASDAPRPESGAYFLHALTLGLNVAFARLATDVARRQRWGPLTYATSALEALANFRSVGVTLHFQGLVAPVVREQATVKCQIVQFTAVNTPVFGGRLHLTLPDVSMRDRLLDFLVIEALEPDYLRETIEGLLAALGRLGEGHRGDGAAAHSGTTDTEADEALGFALPGARRFKARSVVVETEESVDVTLDGEIRAHTPVEVRIAPEPLAVFVPRG